MPSRAIAGVAVNDATPFALDHQGAVVAGEIRVTEHVDGDDRLRDRFGQFDEQPARIVGAGVADEQSDLDVVRDGSNVGQYLRVAEVSRQNAHFRKEDMLLAHLAINDA